MVLPFFEQYLKDGPPAEPGARDDLQSRPRTTGSASNDWPRRLRPRAAQRPLTPLYLQAGFGLGFDKPAAAADASDSYVSDPAKPVPYSAAPGAFLRRRRAGSTWLVRDQRFVDGRTDVLTYETAAADAAGADRRRKPIADLIAATTGTDGDFVVKLIDVYPDKVAAQPEIGGYELPLGDRHLPRPLSEELRAPDADPGQHAPALPFRAART